MFKETASLFIGQMFQYFHNAWQLHFGVVATGMEASCTSRLKVIICSVCKSLSPRFVENAKIQTNSEDNSMYIQVHKEQLQRLEQQLEMVSWYCYSKSYFSFILLACSYVAYV